MLFISWKNAIRLVLKLRILVDFLDKRISFRPRKLFYNWIGILAFQNEMWDYRGCRVAGEYCKTFSVVVITSALHAEGHGFEPRSVYSFVILFFHLIS